MKKIIFILFCLLAFSVPVSFASPPTSIALTYDQDKGNLHVEAIHPTQDLEKNYVRLMNVYVNGDLVNTLNYARQSDYDKFTEDVPVTAQVGDVIKVDLFCFSGGELAQEMKVEKPGAQQPQSADAGGDNSSSDNSTIDNTST